MQSAHLMMRPDRRRHRRASAFAVTGTVLAAAVVLTLVSIGRSAAGSPTPRVALDASTVATLSIPGSGTSSGGVNGDGSPAGHGSDSIELESWSWGASNTSAVLSSGASRGRASIGTFSIRKSIDKSSPIFMQACASGTNLGTGYVYLDEPSAPTGSFTTYATFTLSNLHVVTCTESSTTASGEENPTESLSFAYSSMKFDFTGTPGSTATHFSWDGTVKG